MGIVNQIGELGTFSVETGEVTEITIRKGDRDSAPGERRELQVSV